MPNSAGEVLLFELPFAAEQPSLAGRAGSGVERIVARSSVTFDVDVTLFDTSDHRLLRNGVTLAQRTVDGVRDWYFAAPGWAPLLPAEQISASDEQMPTSFASWTVPIRRHAELTEAVEVRAQRRGYVARGAKDVVIAHLEQTSVTIRAAGMTTARYREVSVEVGPDTTSAQRDELIQAMFDVGATSVAAFPTLHQRIGAPATGQPDIPQRRDWEREDSVVGFVGALLATRTRDVVDADLAIRAGLDDGTAHGEALRSLADDLRGLDGILDPAWSRQMIVDVEAHAASAAPLDGEAYLSILDRLVAAQRIAPTGAQGRRGSAAVLRKSLDEALSTMFAACDKLDVDSSDRRWFAAADAALHAAWRARIWHVLQGKKARQLAVRVSRVADALADCAAVPADPEPSEVEGLAPMEIFEAGRTFERRTLIQDTYRAEFAERWPRRRRKLEKAL